MQFNKITYGRLKEVLNYNQNTGVFTWRLNKSNRVRKGSVAGNICKWGYIVIAIDKKIYKAHRLAWLYVYGYMSENFIDHVDRDRANNKIENLREVSNSCNVINTYLQSNNTSGIKGVSFNKKKKLWSVKIGNNNKKFYIGSFKNKDDAVKARWEAEKQYNFTNCCTDSSAYLYLKENSLIY